MFGMNISVNGEHILRLESSLISGYALDMKIGGIRFESISWLVNLPSYQ